jgi:CheY-like chemotaxis protein
VFPLQRQKANTALGEKSSQIGTVAARRLIHIAACRSAQRGILTARTATHGTDIPVIAVTAYGRPQDKRQAAAAGFRLHLTKPIAPDALAAAVVQVLPAGRLHQR